MGLSAPRKYESFFRYDAIENIADFRRRAKLSNDPNNTQWSRSSTKFGQKILESQGWIPGDFLGPKNAAHSAHHTAANASHIRVTLKDNNLGLGAQPGRSQQDGETTGLDMFQDVLGRLNGKSETQLVTDRKLRIQLRGSNFVEQRWGRLRFVSGGFLVGDKLQALSKDSSSNASHEEPSKIKDHIYSILPKEDEQARSSTLKPKKRKEPRCETAAKKDDFGDFEVTQQREPQSPPQTSDLTESKQDKAQRKAEKAARKLKRQIKRHKKHALEAQDQAAHNVPLLRTVNSEPVGKVGVTKESTVKESKAPSTEAKTFPVVGGSRQAVRQRYIQQKKLSMMDSKALNEVSLWPGYCSFDVRSLIVSIDTDDKGLIGAGCEPLLIQGSIGRPSLTVPRDSVMPFYASLTLFVIYQGVCRSMVSASLLTGPCVEEEMIGSCLGTNPKCAWAIVDEIFD